MKNFMWVMVLSLISLSASASTFEVTVQNLEKNHVNFVFARHLDFDVSHASREVALTPQGAPVSLFFSWEGVSAFYTSSDGATIHTLIKSHRIFLGIPEGVELTLSVSIGGSPVLDFQRTYGLLEMGTLVADLKTVSQNLQDKEWRETTQALIKMMVCAQVEKLRWLAKVLKSSCSQ